MTTVFVYSVSNDFPTQATNDSVLSADISASAITQTLVSAVTVADVVTITFALDLTGGDEIILDDIVATHLLAEFSYSVSGDFPNQLLDASVMTAEIAASSITPVLEDITRTGDDVTMSFDASLSYADHLTLDGLVAAHQGESFFEDVQLLLSEGEQTNTTTTFSQAAQISSPILAAGYYTISVACELAVASVVSNTAVEIQVEWNGSERSIHRSAESLYTSFFTSATLQLNDLASPDLTLNFRKIGASANTAMVRRIRMSIVPLNMDVTEE